MKKLTLLSVMVMLTLTTLCSNNECPQKEQAKSAVSQKSLVELKVNSKLANSETTLNENCKQTTDLSVKNAEMDTKKSNIESDSIESNQKKQCESAYTIGISNVDFIEYVPDLRWWIT